MGKVRAILNMRQRGDTMRELFFRHYNGVYYVFAGSGLHGVAPPFLCHNRPGSHLLTLTAGPSR